MSQVCQTPSHRPYKAKVAQNISRVHMHQSCNSISSAWTPNTCPGAKAIRSNSGEVNAPYFALTYVASFLNGARDFRVTPIQESDETVVYAGYEAGKLSRIAIISKSGEDSAAQGPNAKKTVEIQVPRELAYVHQTARLSLSTLQSRSLIPVEDDLMTNKDQVPIGGKPNAALTLNGGSLSVTMDRTEAVLLEIVSSSI